MPIDDPTPPNPTTKRDVFYTGTFKGDFKRERKGRHRRTIEADLMAAVTLLVDDLPLPAAYVDHALTGPWKDRRDLHLKPDLVLIYRKFDAARAKPAGRPERSKLHLVRLGSHSELGL